MKSKYAAIPAPIWAVESQIRAQLTNRGGTRPSPYRSRHRILCIMWASLRPFFHLQYSVVTEMFPCFGLIIKSPKGLHLQWEGQRTQHCNAARFPKSHLGTHLLHLRFLCGLSQLMPTYCVGTVICTDLFGLQKESGHIFPELPPLWEGRSVLLPIALSPQRRLTAHNVTEHPS